MINQHVVMLDFETTGLSPAQGARIIEVAALTGITQDMVDTAPAVEKVLPELLRFIGTNALATHNANFDFRFLRAECERIDMQADHSELVCSLLLSRRLLPGLDNYRLSSLDARLGIRFSGQAHRAEADAEVSAELLRHLGERLQQHHRCRSIDPALLVAINRLPAAKVPGFLQRQAA